MLRLTRSVLAACAAACLSSVALVAVTPAQAAPDLSPAAARAIEAPYLRAHERAALRVFHGQWEDRGELESPALLAQAALQAGWFHDPVFEDESLGWALRAEAAVRRSDLAAMDRLPVDEVELSAHGALINVLALGESGQAFDDGLVAAIEASFDAVPVSGDREAQVALTAARSFMLGRAADADRARALVRELAELRQRDQLDWRVRLMEADLLIARSNREEGGAALEETLALNPRSAQAWRLFGGLAVDGLDVDRVEVIADQLDEIAREISGDTEAVHPWGELLRARIALRLDDADGAVASMERALAIWPGWHEGLAWLAAAHGAGFDDVARDAALEELEARAPGGALGPYVVGAVLSDLRQYERADEFLVDAVERAPRWPEPWIELGLLRMQSGEDVGALDALTTASELDPFHIRATNSLALVRDLLTYATVESAHFRVRYAGGVDEALARDMLVHLERVHEMVAAAFGFVPDRKTTIELMPTHERFAVRITGLTGIFTIAAATGPVIALEAPRYGKDHTGEFDWLTVIQHEYVHTATLAVTENRIPHWFTEACAVNFEIAERTWDTWQLLASALEGERLFGPVKINLAFTRPETPSDRPLAYAQSAWIYQYILDAHTQGHIRRMLALQREGLTEGEVIESAFGRSFEQFLEEFELWAADDLVRQGVWGEPRLEMLLGEATLHDPSASEQRVESLSGMGLSLDRRARGLRSGAQFELEPVEPSREVLERLAGVHPGHPEVLAALVEIELEEHGQDVPLRDETRALLERYAAARPVDPLPHRLLTLHYRAMGEPEAMLPHLEWLDSRETYSWAYAAELARLFAVRGEHDRAYEKAERATIIAPYRPEHRELAAAAAVKTHRFDEALRHVRALTVLEPDREIHRRRLERLEVLAGE
ncbi:MAG: hypothetical protein AAGI30_09785 [Planctomycetota bacterium]